MGLFSKRQGSVPESMPPGTNTSHPFNNEWFERWWNTIMTDGHVSPSDPQNRLQLIAFTHKLLDDSAVGYFAQQNDADARRQYQLLSADPSTSLGKKVTFLIQWNPQVLKLLGEKFENYRDLLTRSGRQHGRLRFFPSECCGEPLEIDPETGDRVCSKCRRRTA
jgi:hypothetical protein